MGLYVKLDMEIYICEGWAFKRDVHASALDNYVTSWESISIRGAGYLYVKDERRANMGRDMLGCLSGRVIPCDFQIKIVR